MPIMVYLTEQKEAIQKITWVYIHCKEQKEANMGGGGIGVY